MKDCCEKCNAEMWDGPKGKCYSDGKCSCHKSPTSPSWEQEIRQILIPAELVADLEDQIVFQLGMLLSSQRQQVIELVEGFREWMEREYAETGGEIGQMTMDDALDDLIKKLSQMV